MKVCYYGELDPFSGGVSQRASELDGVVSELKLLCLLYDLVIVQPENLLEHSLALPALEALTPFVHAGRLGTSDDPSWSSPRSYIEDRVALYAEDRPAPALEPGARPRRASARAPRTRRDLEEMKSRWCALLPAEWPLTRNVREQASAFCDRVRRFCEEVRTAPTAAEQLLRFIDQSLQAGGGAPSRNVLLAHLAGLRGEAPPIELSLLAMAIQSAYFDVGARGHQPVEVAAPPRVCTLFPGRFAAILRRNAPSLPSLDLPPYEWSAQPFALTHRLGQLGLELEQLTHLDTCALFELSRSTEWLSLRALLFQPDSDPDLPRSIRSVLARFCDLRDALPLISPLLAAAGRPVPTLLPAPWQLAIQAVIGTPRAQDEHAEGSIVLDLRTLTLRDPRRGLSARLTKTQAELVNLLVISGELGLRVEDVKQLSLEVDLLHRGAMDASRVRWMAQAREQTKLAAARLGKVRVQKTRVNKALAPFELRICTDRRTGRWRLVDLRGHNRTPTLDGAVWDVLEVESGAPAPAFLAPQQARLWSAIIASSPDYLSLRILAAALGGRADKRRLTRAACAIHKLARALEAHGARYRLVRPQRGLYGIIEIDPHCS